MLNLRPNDTLLIIDLQNDFLPGGALGVPRGDEIIPGINALAAQFEHVVLTQDWHPRQHVSFAVTHPGKQPFSDSVETHHGTQSLWPEHCIQGTHGAALTSALEVSHAELVLRKGSRTGIDSYSAFVENDRCTRTGLAGYLRERELHRLFLVGLALDFCVGASALDAQRLGFEAIVVEDLTRAVNLPGTTSRPDSVAHIHQLFAQHNVRCSHAAMLGRRRATAA